MSFGLGRIESIDERDLNFPMRLALPEPEPVKRFKYWNPSGIWLDQGSTSSCVGHSWAHMVMDGPIVYRKQVVNPYLIYDEARKVDEWEGEAYDGTSVRAGAKVLLQMGYISAYTWAFDLETMIKAVLTTSPVVVGSYWYNDMFYPDNKGVIKITGGTAGGHAYLINGVNRDKAMFRIKNSWGRSWGVKGHGYISFEDMEKLIYRDGEICLPIEIKKP